MWSPMWSLPVAGTRGTQDEQRGPPQCGPAATAQLLVYVFETDGESTLSVCFCTENGNYKKLRRGPKGGTHLIWVRGVKPEWR